MIPNKSFKGWQRFSLVLPIIFFIFLISVSAATVRIGSGSSSSVIINSTTTNVNNSDYLDDLDSTYFQYRNDWTTHNDYPSNCGAGEYVYGIGDTLLCSSPASSGGTYNATYATWLPNYTLYNKFWYNMSDGTGSGNSSWNESRANLLYAEIKWGYNQTYSGSTYNATYASINTTYNYLWYNMSNYPITYLNTTYGKWWYNMTYSGSTYNATYASINTTYNYLWYNHTSAANSSIVSNYGKWFYNQTYSGSTYNATYDNYARNNTIFNNVTVTDSILNNGNRIYFNSTCVIIKGNGGSTLNIC